MNKNITSAETVIDAYNNQTLARRLITTPMWVMGTLFAGAANVVTMRRHTSEDKEIFDKGYDITKMAIGAGVPNVLAFSPYPVAAVAVLGTSFIVDCFGNKDAGRFVAFRAGWKTLRPKIG